MLLGAPPLIHAGQRRVAPQIPLPHPSPSPLLQVCILHGCLQQPSVLLLVSLLLHAQAILHTWSLERPFPNRVKQDPARHTCEVSLPPPGVGLDLKADFPEQVLSCQFYLFFIYLFIFQFYTSMMWSKLVT